MFHGMLGSEIGDEMVALEYFEYGDEEVAFLKGRCPKMAAAIDRIGHIERAVTPDLYAALVNCIVGQQISTAAHKTIWKRMVDQLGNVTPESIGSLSDERLQSFGISHRKAGYIRGVTNRMLDGSLDLDAIAELPDDEVIKALVELPGIGTWTAEMLLTFSLQRPDVMSYGDLAIQRGLRMLYHHRAITPKLFAKYRRRFSPHGTVASLYLWAIAGGAIPEMRDYAPKKKPSASRKRS